MWSIWQLSTGAIIIVPYTVWALFGAFILFSILWYEVAFISAIPVNETDENRPIGPLPDDQWI